MAQWSSLVVLSLAVVSTLSFPQPDAAYKIPTVGLGTRAQYYVLHSDGSYKFGYDTADGAYEQAMASAPGQVNGAFGYKDPTGANIKLEYTADDRGFIPTGDHLPVAPEALSAAAVGSGSFGVVSAAPTTYTGATAQATQVFPSAPAVPSAPSGPVEVANVQSSASDDGSYSFAYQTSSSSRQESGDSHNSVHGRYSFVADDGVDRSITYEAGAEKGYIAEGDSIPVGPPVPGAESGRPTGRILPILSEAEANALAAATSSSFRASGTAGAAGTHFTGATNGNGISGATGAATGAATSATQYSATGPSDASYSFSYDAGDSARQESADANLNVQGSYSFVPVDTQHKLTVNYKAGADTGFVATGDHLPVAPEASAAAATTYTASSAAHAVHAPAAPVFRTAATAAHVSPVKPSLVPHKVSSGHSSHVVGDVLLHQYGVTGDKFGYAYSAVRR